MHPFLPLLSYHQPLYAGHQCISLGLLQQGLLPFLSDSSLSPNQFILLGPDELTLLMSYYYQIPLLHKIFQQLSCSWRMKSKLCKLVFKPFHNLTPASTSTLIFHCSLMEPCIPESFVLEHPLCTSTTFSCTRSTLLEPSFAYLFPTGYWRSSIILTPPWINSLFHSINIHWMC